MHPSLQNLEDICVASLAKRFEEVYLPGNSEPVRIPRDSEALYLLQQVRDEAHRFAITYHRQLRDKKMIVSVLDDVPGLGPTRKKRLLKEFGSVKKLRELAEERCAANGLTLRIPRPRLCTDNGAMIASFAAHLIAAGASPSPLDAASDPGLPVVKGQVA